MKDREKNLGELVKAGFSPDDAMTVQKLARRLHRIDENDCNGYQDWKGNWDKAAEEKADRESERIEKRLSEMAQKYGFLFYHQSDPRGWPVYFVKPESLGEYTIDAVYDRGPGVCPR